MVVNFIMSQSSIPLDLPPAPEAAPPLPPGVAGEQMLAGAFASFREAASSLEHSYAQLHGEVHRLRRELEASNQELKSSLRENRAVRDFLHHILEALPCGVLVTKASGEITLANPEARRLLAGSSAAAVEGKKVPSWMEESGRGRKHGSKEDAKERDEKKALEKNGRNEQNSSTREHECSPDGALWIAVRQALLHGGGVDHTVLTLRDITQTRQLETLREELGRREALTEMSALLAHEIRNPLASLELFAGLLAESPLAEDCSCWVRHVQAGLRTLAATVNNVLQFRGHPQPELVPTHLGELLAHFENFLSPVARQAQVRICLEHQLKDVFILADRNRLQQVLFNVAWNAFRFMPDGGTLTISGRVQNRKEERFALISIRDTGCGIPPEVGAKIFQPGFTTRPGSPGLGLAVCRELIHQHGGNISVESDPGEGATFHLELRLAENIKQKGQTREMAKTTKATRTTGTKDSEILCFPGPECRPQPERMKPLRAGGEP